MRRWTSTGQCVMDESCNFTGSCSARTTLQFASSSSSTTPRGVRTFGARRVPTSGATLATSASRCRRGPTTRFASSRRTTSGTAGRVPWRGRGAPRRPTCLGVTRHTSAPAMDNHTPSSSAGRHDNFRINTIAVRTKCRGKKDKMPKTSECY